MQKIIKTYWAPILVLLVLLWVGFTTPYKNGPVIRSDGRGYHAWTHMLLQGSLGSCSIKSLGLLDQLENGKCINKYPMGVALIRLPFFMFYANDLQKDKIHGFEHAVVLWVSIILCFLSFLIFYGLARSQGWSDTSSWVASLVALFGTGLFHYGTYDASFSHIYTVFCFASLIYLCFVSNRSEFWRWICISCLAWWAIMIRNTNIFMIFTMLALLFFQENRNPIRVACMLCLGVGLAILSQIAINSYLMGAFTISSYSNEGFVWDRPMAHYIFVSYERGLLNYYPAFALVFGLLFYQGIASGKLVSLILAGMIVFYALMYGFWHSWMLAGGFGHRGFVDLVPLVFWGALGLKSFLPEREKILSALFGISVSVTLIFMAGYWNGTFPFSNATHEIYWKQFSIRMIKENFSGFLNNARLPTIHEDSRVD